MIVIFKTYSSMYIECLAISTNKGIRVRAY